MKTNFTSEKSFIKAIAPSAQKACKRYGYLPSVLIAQACLENGYGISSYWDNQEIKSLLQYNNMIGQKAQLLNSSWYDKSVWPGKSFNKKTPEVYSNEKTTKKDNFRIFDDIEQSFCDFILFLLYASNYGYNGKPKYGQQVVNIKDPNTLISEVRKRGYATDPNYPTSVMKIVNKHNLTQYDDLSKVEASKYIPDALKETKGDNKMNIPDKVIHDITKNNLNQIPASRGANRIKWIVIHYLGVPNADNPNLYGGGYGGHYNITRNGEIYKAADPKTAVVWHCGGGLQGPNGHQYYKLCTNYNSISIENSVCYTDPSEKNPSPSSDKWYFTTATQKSLVFLVSKLMDEFNIDINHVIRHYDVTGKICPNPYVKNNKLKTSWTWTEFKNKLLKYRNTKSDTKITIVDDNTPASTNKSTKEMQQMLIKLGYDCGAAGADGILGANTKKAIKAFQKDNQLIVDGIYGPQTEKALLQKYNELQKPKNYAQSFDKSIAKTYITTSKLNLRSAASLNGSITIVIPKNATVTCYGYHTDDWYYVTYDKYTGFCNSKWLK